MARQRHKYEYRVDPHTAAAKIVRMVGTNKRVLELGSGPGAITSLLKENACRVTALEIDPKAIDIVTPYCEQVLSCDLNDPQWTDTLSKMGRFDVIVAGDVLEHLYDPWATLLNLHELLTDHGQVIISLPHAGHNAIVSCLLTGNFEYGPWGLLDKTHIRFFAIHNIQKLFNDAGYKIIEADFVVKRPEQTEFAKYWRQLPVGTQKALEVNPFSLIYQVVIKAVPRSAPGRGLRLAAMSIPSPTATAYSIGAKGNRFIGFLLSFISLRNRDRISRALQQIGFRL